MGSCYLGGSFVFLATFFCRSLALIMFRISLVTKEFGPPRSLTVIYCAFHKHANSKVQKPPSQFAFFAAVNHNYDHKQRTLKHRNSQNGSKSTNHESETMTF